MTNNEGNKQLSLKDCYDMTLKMGDKVEAAWRQFYVVILAIAAWGFATNTASMSYIARLALLFAALTFTVHSCIALLNLYLLLSVLVKETYARVTDGHFFVGQNRDIFLKAQGNINYERVKVMVIGTHSLCFTVVSYIYLSR